MDFRGGFRTAANFLTCILIWFFCGGLPTAVMFQNLSSVFRGGYSSGLLKPPRLDLPTLSLAAVHEPPRPAFSGGSNRRELTKKNRR